MRIIDVPVDEQLSTLQIPELLAPISSQEAKKIAILTALRGIGRVGSNPLVGAVAVDRHHRFLAAGAHEVYGQAHAEQNLLLEVKRRGLVAALAEASVYVTLEPCSHEGKTPSCAKLLRQYPLRRVCYGQIDPNPNVNGSGIALLRDSGVECVYDPVFASEAEFINASYFNEIKRGEPLFAIKAALSLNQVAAHRGDRRRWITSKRSRSYGHWLRVLYDAILVGANTEVLDNPILDSRLALVRGRDPWKIVLDPFGRALMSRPIAETRIFSKNPQRSIWVSNSSFWNGVGSDHGKRLGEMGVRIMRLEHGCALSQLSSQIRQLGISSVLVEGGMETWRACMRAQIVSRGHFFFAPFWLATDDALQFDLGPQSLESPSITVLDSDYVIEGRLGPLKEG